MAVGSNPTSGAILLTVILTKYRVCLSRNLRITFPRNFQEYSDIYSNSPVPIGDYRIKIKFFYLRILFDKVRNFDYQLF